MTHPTRAFSGSIINRFTGSKILDRVGQISVAFPIVAIIRKSPITCWITGDFPCYVSFNSDTF